MAKVRCKCGKVLTFKPEHGGKRAKCPACSTVVRLPVVTETGPDKSQAPPEPAQPGESPRAEKPEASAIFWSAFPGAFLYPLAGGGLRAFIIAVIVFGAGHYLAVLASPIAPTLPMITDIFLAGYLVGFLMEVMRRTARGRDEAPEWPALKAYRKSALEPLMFGCVLGIISVGPLLLYVFAVRRPNPLIEFVILAVGMFYMPMGLLRGALTKDIAKLNPLEILRAITVVPGQYLAAWILMAAPVAVQVFNGDPYSDSSFFKRGFFGESLIERYLSVPVLGYVLHLAASIYLLFVAARVTGLLFHAASDRIGWRVVAEEEKPKKKKKRSELFP